MKTIILFLVLAILIGCAGSSVGPIVIDPPPPPPVTKKYIAEVESDSNIIISPSNKIEVLDGGNASFTFTTKFGYVVGDSATINGKSLLLVSTTGLTLFGITENKTIKIFSQKTPLGFLSQNYWKSSLWKKKMIATGVVTTLVPVVYTYKFGESNRFQEFNSHEIFNATTLVGDGTYILTTDSLIIGPNQTNGTGGIRSKIITLKSDSLVLRSISRGLPGEGIDSEIEAIFIP